MLYKLLAVDEAEAIVVVAGALAMAETGGGAFGLGSKLGKE